MSSLTKAQQEQFSKNSGLFALDVYAALRQFKPNENIVFSPFSIQTCAAMARVGAEGKTAEELDRGLRLISDDAATIAESFSNVLAHYENSSDLKIANRIYVMKGYNIRKEFQDIVTKQFQSGAEEINFADGAAAAATINGWVESKTNNLIKNLIDQSSLDSSTRLVLLNAIHFKGTWLHKFRKQKTSLQDFYLNEVDTVKVEMMSQTDNFLFAKLPELQATVIEMQYQDSDLSMLVILPNSRTGLKDLEQKLMNMPLSDITKKMSMDKVHVKFPKFKAEFSIQLNEPMKMLGMTRMFSGQAEFGKMLEETESLAVSKVIHKAFIDVTEEGTEAAAATAMLIRKKRALDAYFELNDFNVEHPFFYILYARESTSALGDGSTSQNVVLFAGTLLAIADASASFVKHDEL